MSNRFPLPYCNMPLLGSRHTKGCRVSSTHSSYSLSYHNSVLFLAGTFWSFIILHICPCKSFLIYRHKNVRNRQCRLKQIICNKTYYPLHYLQGAQPNIAPRLRRYGYTNKSNNMIVPLSVNNITFCSYSCQEPEKEQIQPLS